jgi:hypothetical protein
MKNREKKLELYLGILMLFNICLVVMAFSNQKSQKFEEIDVERINIVESDGTLKLALFNSERLTRGLDGDKRKGTGSISGMLFYNQEGYEAGGMVFDGRKIDGGQMSGAGLMFDVYRQDQTIALQHNEKKDSLTSYYEDGLKIMSRPDRSHVKEEYAFYALKYPNRFGNSDTPKLTKKEMDSIELVLSSQNKVAQRRLWLGTKRGDTGNGWFDETGLYIKNKYGKDMIRIYVDNENKPKFEILDSLGTVVKYNLIPE